ncbi:ATP-binding protein, partial [Thermoplasmatota archaeon]
GEKASIDFDNYLKILEKEKRCFFIPFELKKVEIRNIGVITKLEINFDKQTIIEGNFGEGKTTLIKSVANVFGYDIPNFHNLLSSRKKPYGINVVIKPESKINLSFNEEGLNTFKQNRTIRCIIIDEPMDILSLNLKNEFLSYLSSLNTQIILTNTPEEHIKYPKEYNIYRLKQNKKGRD